MINDYVIEPHWANWMLVLEMFVAGVASGTYFFISLVSLAGNREDRIVAARASLVPLPLMLLVAPLLVFDLGEPGRFLNLIFRSPIAEERGPGAFMLNANSPMNWGTYIIVIFGLFTAIAFADALLHLRRLPATQGLVEGIAHNPIVLGLGAFFALATGAYSGVLLNVTNQNVWGDTVLVGALFVTFTALSGMAVGAIIADRERTRSTAVAIRGALIMFIWITAVVVAAFMIALALQGTIGPLVASLLTGPVFWALAIGGTIVAPIVLLVLLRPAAAPRLALIGAIVLVGVLAFRYAILYSAVAALG